MAVDIDAVPRGTVTVTLNFFTPPADGSKPFNYVDTPPPGEPQRNFTFSSHKVTIQDGRGRELSFTLDHHAFQLRTSIPPSALSVTHFLAPNSDDAIRAAYYPEVEQLLLNTVPGANRVVLFDHTVRHADPVSKRAPVQQVHIDQTVKSTKQRVRRHVADPEEAEKLLQGRYRIINVWRPLTSGPLESFPLAFANSATLSDEDVIPTEHRYPPGALGITHGMGDYTGETASIQFGDGQEWFYWSGMTSEERVLLECFDSEAGKSGSGVRGGRVAHTAFEDPRTREGAEPRASIEVRALVFGP